MSVVSDILGVEVKVTRRGARLKRINPRAWESIKTAFEGAGNEIGLPPAVVDQLLDAAEARLPIR